MFSLLRCIRRAPVLLGITSLLLFLPGCPLSPDDDPGGPGGGDIRLDRSTIPGTIDWVAKVWTNRLYDEYEMVLHDQFEFYPKAVDADDLPWLEGDSWGRSTELAMAEHMFDPNYSNPGAEAVVSIDMDFAILNQTPQGDVIQVDCQADILVMVGPNDGFRSDTRFHFDVVPDPDEPGLFQVIRQEEVERQ